VPEPPRLSTLRLRLRSRTRADLNANVTMDLDPEVYRYYDVHFSVRETAEHDSAALRKRIKSQIASGWPPEGFLWTVEWKEQPGFLGIIGLSPCPLTRSTALGFRLIRSVWGQGIATEAALAVLPYGFRSMKLPTIIALVHPENRRSQRVVAKIGMRCEGAVLVRQRSVLIGPQPSHANSNYSNKYICYLLDYAGYREDQIGISETRAGFDD
jgi:RimJ/RimL family protein N-acetyltransferase